MVRTEFKHSGLGIELPNLTDLKEFAQVIKEKNMKNKLNAMQSGKIVITDQDEKIEMQLFRKGVLICSDLDVGLVPNDTGVLLYALTSANALKLFKLVPYSQIEILETEK